MPQLNGFRRTSLFRTSPLSTPSSPVAVILFTRSAGEEATRKQFVSTAQPDRNAAVAALLIEQATAAARQAGVDFLCVDSTQQVGHSFGLRLVGAMQRAFALGYEQLLVIGNDCPQLDAARLRRAVALLQTSGAVLGPATDGGVYLIGVAKAHFDAAAWAELPWQTPALGVALARQLRRHGAAVSQLPPLSDVDNEQDLVRVLRQPLLRALQRALCRLRAIAYHRQQHQAAPLLPAFAAARPHRGPPPN